MQIHEMQTAEWFMNEYGVGAWFLVLLVWFAILGIAFLLNND